MLSRSPVLLDDLVLLLEADVLLKEKSITFSQQNCVVGVLNEELS